MLLFVYQLQFVKNLFSFILKKKHANPFTCSKVIVVKPVKISALKDMNLNFSLSHVSPVWG